MGTLRKFSATTESCKRILMHSISWSFSTKEYCWTQQESKSWPDLSWMFRYPYPLIYYKAVWRTAIFPLQNDNGAASKFKAQTGGLQLWPWPWVCIVELWVLHIIPLRQTFDPNLINIFQRVQEIWSKHEIQGSNSWPLTVTLTLSRNARVMGSAHRLTKANIWPKFHENLSKGSGDMEQSLSYRFYTSSH